MHFSLGLDRTSLHLSKNSLQKLKPDLAFTVNNRACSFKRLALFLVG